MTCKQKSCMDNKVVIKVIYQQGFETHMSWKAIIKLKRLGYGVWFEQSKDADQYWRALQCLT